MNNLLTIQPAYAGMSGYVNVTAMSRIQWVGFDGAPQSNTLTIQGPFKKYNVGLGFSIVTDRAGPYRQTGFYADYSFRILLNSDQYISFGIKGGFNRYQAMLSELFTHDPNDPVGAFDINKKYMPNFGVGFMWHADNFFVGLSVPKFFQIRLIQRGEPLSIRRSGIFMRWEAMCWMSPIMLNLNRLSWSERVIILLRLLIFLPIYCFMSECGLGRHIGLKIHMDFYFRHL